MKRRLRPGDPSGPIDLTPIAPTRPPLGQTVTLTAVGTATRAEVQLVDDSVADLSRRRPEPAAVALVAESVARAYRVMPMRIVDGALHVAVVDSEVEGLFEAMSAIAVEKVWLFVAPASDVQRSLDAHYRLVSAEDEQVRKFWESAAPVETAVTQATSTAPIIQVVNKLIAQALRDRASDLHVEPTDGRVRIRYRVDGALREVLSLPLSVGPELVSRIKVMADMDIVERRRPQDGQFQVTVDGANVDIRVATSATIWGETAVLRLLDKRRSLRALTDLGMPANSLERYLAMIQRPYGMIACSGPTGAGKTTTLYASLAEIARDDLNVMTIEDPVEYVFPTVNQMQINLQADITFASGLKAILRQDPDVILVGEIRDRETAGIAVQAALTGHLVMSSIHATDASSALFRFIDMGIEPFIVASSLVGVVGQRLVRRICNTCIVEYEPTEQELRLYTELGGPTKTTFVRGAGCEYCSGTGYRGRTAVYEVLEVTEQVGQTLVSGATPHDIRGLAVSQGMRPMRAEAVNLVADDLTTIDEVHRNVFISGGSYLPPTKPKSRSRKTAS